MKTICLKQIQSVAQSLWIDHDELERAFSSHEPSEAADFITKESGDLLNTFDQKGIRLYAQLMRSSWYEVMSSIYPHCQKILGDDWQQVVDGYIKTVPPAHFNLNQLAQRFSDYLATQQAQQSRPSFLPELADYEWLELEVMEHPASVADLQQLAPSSLEDFLTLTPLVNPTLYIRHYRFPIQRIATILENDEEFASHQVAEQPSILAAFRPPSAHHCEFLGISELAVAVTEAAQATKVTYGDLAKLVINKCFPAPAENSSLQFIEMIEHFHDTGLFIGATNAKT